MEDGRRGAAGSIAYERQRYCKERAVPKQETVQLRKDRNAHGIEDRTKTIEVDWPIALIADTIADSSTIRGHWRLGRRSSDTGIVRLGSIVQLCQYSVQNPLVYRAH